jgi:hypothetical protein
MTMTPLLPAPDADEPEPNARGRSSKKRIPSIDDILEMLQQLNGLVALNLLSTAKAAVMHRNLRTILEVQLRRSQAGTGELPQEDLAELCRQNPRLLSILEGFLTDEQVRWLTGRVTEDDNDQA